MLFDNSWQVFISYAYIIYNSPLSTFLVADELVGFAKTRRRLRVSAPMGIQRSSYFASIPARYGISMIVTIGLLHWIVSQSLFVICIDRYYSSGLEATSERYVISGFSCVAILTCKSLSLYSVTWRLKLSVAIIIGIVLLIALVAVGMRRYSGEMPLVSTCSAAISALCHLPEGHGEVLFFPVKYGKVSHDEKVLGIAHLPLLRMLKSLLIGVLTIGVLDYVNAICL